jgi:hypothetical protein
MQQETDMKQIDGALLANIQQRADDNRYGYSERPFEGATEPTFPDSTFYTLGPGQSFTFDLYDYPGKAIYRRTAGPGTIIEHVEVVGGWHRIYKIISDGRAYHLSET